MTVSLNNQNIKSNPERITKIKPFIDQDNWKEISLLSHQKYWKSLNYIPHNIEEIKHAFVSKYNTNHENQVILLIITDGKNSIIL